MIPKPLKAHTIDLIAADRSNFLKKIFRRYLPAIWILWLAGASFAADTPNTKPLVPAVSPPKASTAISTASPVTLLQACWSASELRGSAADKLIKRKTATESSPKLLPNHTQLSAARFIGSIRQVKPYHGAKLVALTFDLCEAAYEKSGYDAELVNYLRDHQIKATFFAGGQWMRSHPDKTMQLMADPLFELGNHTWSHRNLQLTHGPDLNKQIVWTQAEYQTLREKLLSLECVKKSAPQASANIPPTLTLFRFPYGICDTEALAAVNQSGLAAIQWNIVTGDPAKGQTAGLIAQTVISQIQPGSIVIAHANGHGWHTAQALPKIVSELTARGYRFVTVSELLASGEVVTVNACYENKLGDNRKYDRLFKIGTKP